MVVTDRKLKFNICGVLILMTRAYEIKRKQVLVTCDVIFLMRQSHIMFILAISLFQTCIFRQSEFIANLYENTSFISKSNRRSLKYNAIVKVLKAGDSK